MLSRVVFASSCLSNVHDQWDKESITVSCSCSYSVSLQSK